MNMKLSLFFNENVKGNLSYLLCFVRTRKEHGKVSERQITELSLILNSKVKGTWRGNDNGTISMLNKNVNGTWKGIQKSKTIMQLSPVFDKTCKDNGAISNY